MHLFDGWTIRERGTMTKKRDWKERANQAEDECESLRLRVGQLERTRKFHDELRTRFDELQHEHERVLMLLYEMLQTIGDIFGRAQSQENDSHD
jgi:hypothetical protein